MVDSLFFKEPSHKTSNQKSLQCPEGQRRAGTYWDGSNDWAPFCLTDIHVEDSEDIYILGAIVVGFIITWFLIWWLVKGVHLFGRTRREPPSQGSELVTLRIDGGK